MVWDSYPAAPNLLMRNFTAEKPNQIWVGDITYIPTWEGWLYLAIVKDLCHKKIVWYAFSCRIDTALTRDALRMAYRREKPGKGLIFHSDRGVHAYRQQLESFHMTQSMSRKGESRLRMLLLSTFSGRAQKIPPPMIIEKSPT